MMRTIFALVLATLAAAAPADKLARKPLFSSHPHPPVCAKPDGCNAPIDTMAETVRAIIGASLPPNLVCLTYYSTCGVIEGPVACIATAVARLVQSPVVGIPRFLRDLRGCLVGSSFAGALPCDTTADGKFLCDPDLDICDSCGVEYDDCDGYNPDPDDVVIDCKTYYECSPDVNPEDPSWIPYTPEVSCYGGLMACSCNGYIRR